MPRKSGQNIWGLTPLALETLHWLYRGKTTEVSRQQIVRERKSKSSADDVIFQLELVGFLRRVRTKHRSIRGRPPKLFVIDREFYRKRKLWRTHVMMTEKEAFPRIVRRILKHGQLHVRRWEAQSFLALEFRFRVPWSKQTRQLIQKVREKVVREGHSSVDQTIADVRQLREEGLGKLVLASYLLERLGDQPRIYVAGSYLTDSLRIGDPGHVIDEIRKAWGLIAS